MTLNDLRCAIAADGRQATVVDGRVRIQGSVPADLAGRIRANRDDLVAVLELEERMGRGRDQLWAWEQAGQTGGDYDRWMTAYDRLVNDYRVLCLSSEKREVTA